MVASSSASRSGIAHRQGVAEQDDFHPAGNPGQNRGFDIHHATATERRLVVLVEHHPVKAQLFGVDALVQIFVHQLAAALGIEYRVGDAKITRAVFDDGLFRDINIFPFREGHNVHGASSFAVCGLAKSRRG